MLCGVVECSRNVCCGGEVGGALRTQSVALYDFTTSLSLEKKRTRVWIWDVCHAVCSEPY